MGAYLMMTALAGIAGLVTVLYAISALGRLVPVKRRHHDWKQVTGMSAVTLLAVGVAGGIYGMAHGAATASTPRPSPVDRAVSGRSLPIWVFAPGGGQSLSPVQPVSPDARPPVPFSLHYLRPD